MPTAHLTRTTTLPIVKNSPVSMPSGSSKVASDIICLRKLHRPLPRLSSKSTPIEFESGPVAHSQRAIHLVPISHNRIVAKIRNRDSLRSGKLRNLPIQISQDSLRTLFHPQRPATLNRKRFEEKPSSQGHGNHRSTGIFICVSGYHAY